MTTAPTISVVVCSPEQYQPKPTVLAGAREVAHATGGEIVVSSDPASAVLGADAVYTDVWVSMGEESERKGALRTSPATGSTRGSWSARGRERSSCTASRPTAARR